MRTSHPRGPGMAMDLRPTPMVLRLLIANIVIWLLFGVLVNLAGQQWVGEFFSEQLTLRPHDAILGLKVWQLLSYSWLHDLGAASHLILNMLFLFFVGPALEKRWGGRSFLTFYLWAGLIAGAVTCLAGLALPSLFSAGVVGASGAIMAVFAAFSLVMPEATVLLFFVIPIQAKWVIWIVVAIDTVVFVAAGADGGSRVAWHTHMGGVLAAWLLVTGNWRPRLLWNRLLLRYLKGRRSTRKAGPDLTVLPGGRDKDLLN
ncbi:MAG: rhomboid family intramembrane serine protease [Myxococcota bacterium]|nr:rhomboid family intramembrane serine protease [Myxococcota bacterium]